MARTIFTCSILLFLSVAVCGQAADALVAKVKAKLSAINDYEATGTMKTDVSFMKVPESVVTIYYKKPDKFRIRKKEGISVTPKGGISISLNALLSGDNYTAVPAGAGNGNVSIVKLLPFDEVGEVVVSTLYIDEKALLITRAVVTTKSSGTYEMNMQYGRYANWCLPDKIILTFNTQAYKLPKGLAFDYDTGDKIPEPERAKDQKGKVELSYSSYSINKGITDGIFR